MAAIALPEAVAVAFPEDNQPQQSYYVGPGGVSGGGSLQKTTGGTSALPTVQFNEAAVRQYLESESYPPGLIEECITSTKKYPMRFFICDDSGSMMTMDGNKIVLNPNKPGIGIHVKCSRWDELGTSMRFHAKLAEISGTFCQFKFLNGPTITFPRDLEGNGVATLDSVLSGSPGGGTPLCRAILDVEREIGTVASTLKSTGQNAVITIFTDGEATDGNLVNAMKPLQLLPVWVVIRLSTDEDKVVNYWNNVDDELELQIDVLDDLSAEATQVQGLNPFLVYTESLHHMREWGMQLKEMDHIDERQLSLDQVHKVVQAFVGKQCAAELPKDYHENLDAYVSALRRIFNGPRFRKVHNVVTARPDTWIRPDDILRLYGKKGCTLM